MTEPTPFPTTETVNAGATPTPTVATSSPGNGDSEGGRVDETPSIAREGLDEAKAAVRERAQAAFASADQVFEDFLSRVRAQPLAAIGIAFAIGALIARVSR